MRTTAGSHVCVFWGLVWMLMAAAALCWAQSKPAMGLQVNLGLGFTKGLDAREELDIALEGERPSATSLRFGATYQLPLSDRFYLNPTFQVGFFSQTVEFTNGTELEWGTTQFCLGVCPSYHFLPQTEKIRPYSALGFKLSLSSFGDYTATNAQGNTMEIDAADGKTGLAFGPAVGVICAVNDRISIPIQIQYDILLAKNMSGLFLFSSGAAFYF